MAELKKAYILKCMTVYRIAKNKQRAKDLSGKGAFIEGGRWNNAGVFALYTSESRALAMLEMLVHAEETELPPNMYIITIKFDDKVPVYKVRDNELPKDWREPENVVLKNLGDYFLKDKKYFAVKVRSAVMPDEYNIVLNPLYPNYHSLVKVARADLLDVDERLK